MSAIDVLRPLSSKTNDVTGNQQIRWHNHPHILMPLESDAKPITDPTVPHLMVDNSTATDPILVMWDEGRSKWLTPGRIQISAGDNGSTSAGATRVLEIYNGTPISSAGEGWCMWRAGTVTAMSVGNQNSGTYSVFVRKNGVASNLATLTITGARSGSVRTTNLDFAANDSLHFLLSVDGGSAASITDILFACEISWRGWP